MDIHKKEFLAFLKREIDNRMKNQNYEKNMETIKEVE